MTLARTAHDERGFTLVEMMVAMLIMVGITGTIFALVNPAKGTYRTQPEVTDMQQRLRVGSSFLKDDLIMAGAGSQTGTGLTGSLMNFFAPVQPVRLGGANADPANGVFFRDNTISVFYIPAGAPQATIAQDMPQPSAELQVAGDPSCGPNPDKLCNWEIGMRVLVFDEQGAFDTATITQVQPGAGGFGVEGMIQHNKHIAGNELSKRYQIGAQVAQVRQRTYYWDPNTIQLKIFDGADRDEAVIDNVVSVRFEYYGDPRPPFLMPDGQTTTYGPRPPSLVTQIRGNGNNDNGAWPAGENCAFKIDPANGMNRIARIPDLAPGSQLLVPLTEQMLTDGPWCPDANFPTRFDVDLLRVRKIGVVLRVQVAAPELRGAIGELFARGGRGQNARTLVPDQEVRFEMAPRNFNLSR
jgi:prepilin-type N-terminal cleavage/methylation domain-containing protein